MRKPSQEIKMLLGKRIKRIKGFRHVYNRQFAYASFVLFDDKQTILELEEQGPEYHDCSTCARIMRVFQDKDRWLALINNDDIADATELT
jgi:predicted oxidoreductase (fatty acid repression mutant protein)